MLLLIWGSAGIADDKNQLHSINASQHIHSKVGALNFYLNILDDRSKPTYAEIVVTRHNKKLQTMPVEIWINESYFEFMDLNDDGFQDLLFYNADAGMCCGATIGADVFLYMPRQSKFIKSTELSGLGNISKLTAKSCVNVNFKSSQAGYTDEQWCFNSRINKWELILSNRLEAAPE